MLISRDYKFIAESTEEVANRYIDHICVFANYLTFTNLKESESYDEFESFDDSSSTSNSEDAYHVPQQNLAVKAQNIQKTMKIKMNKQ